MWISGARIIFILISSPVGLRRSLRAAIDCSSLMPNARLLTGFFCLTTIIAGPVCGLFLSLRKKHAIPWQ